MDHHLVPPAKNNYQIFHCWLVRLHARRPRGSWSTSALWSTMPSSRLPPQVIPSMGTSSYKSSRLSFSAGHLFVGIFITSYKVRAGAGWVVVKHGWWNFHVAYEHFPNNYSLRSHCRAIITIFYLFRHLTPFATRKLMIRKYAEIMKGYRHLKNEKVRSPLCVGVLSGDWMLLHVFALCCLLFSFCSRSSLIYPPQCICTSTQSKSYPR